jgi:hypothetical protein
MIGWGYRKEVGMHISTKEVKVGDLISTRVTRGEYVEVYHVQNRGPQQARWYVCARGKDAEFVIWMNDAGSVEVLF